MKNPVFEIEKKYAQVLTIIFVSFTYGYIIPFVFVWSASTLVIMFILDKLLITYYHKERVINSDLLDRVTLKISKYAIALFLIFGGISTA